MLIPEMIPALCTTQICTTHIVNKSPCLSFHLENYLSPSPSLPYSLLLTSLKCTVLQSCAPPPSPTPTLINLLSLRFLFRFFFLCRFPFLAVERAEYNSKTQKIVVEQQFWHYQDFVHSVLNNLSAVFPGLHVNVCVGVCFTALQKTNKKKHLKECKNVQLWPY